MPSDFDFIEDWEPPKQCNLGGTSRQPLERLLESWKLLSPLSCARRSWPSPTLLHKWARAKAIASFLTLDGFLFMKYHLCAYLYWHKYAAPSIRRFNLLPAPRSASLVTGIRARFLKNHKLLNLFAQLTGAQPAPAAAISMALLTPLYDAVFDENNNKVLGTPKNLLMIIKARLENRPSTPSTNCESLIDHLVGVLARNLPTDNRASFAHHYERLHHEQVSELIRSSCSSIPDAQIERSTLIKGGLSALLFIYIFDRILTPSEEQTFFFLGGLLQILDDLEDFRLDHISGRRTLATKNSIQVDVVFDALDTYQRHLENSILHHGYDAATARSFFRALSLHAESCTKKYSRNLSAMQSQAKARCLL